MFEAERLFRDVVQERSVSRAAKLNGISQSAASQQISELERRLQFQLLNRTTRPLYPTQAGKLYFELSRDVLRREEEFRASLEALQKKTEGQVRIASIYSVGVSEIPWHRAEFHKRFPLIELVLSLRRPNLVYEAVMEDQADLGLVSYPETARELTVIPWREEPMSVAVPLGHPWSACDSLSVHQLEGESFVAFDDDLAIRRHVDRYLKESGVRVEITFNVDNIEMLKTCVSSGSGISILPHCVDDRLAMIPLREPLRRPVAIIHRRGKVLSRAAQLFIDQLAANPELPQSCVDLPRLAADRLAGAAESLDVSD